MGKASAPASMSAIAARSATDRPASRHGWFCPSTFSVDAALEEQQRAGRQHGEIRHAIDDEVGSDPFGPEFGQSHAPGDVSEFVGCDNASTAVRCGSRFRADTTARDRRNGAFGRRGRHQRFRRSRAQVRPPPRSGSRPSAPRTGPPRAPVSLRARMISACGVGSGICSSMMRGRWSATARRSSPKADVRSAPPIDRRRARCGCTSPQVAS